MLRPREERDTCKLHSQLEQSQNSGISKSIPVQTQSHLWPPAKHLCKGFGSVLGGELKGRPSEREPGPTRAFLSCWPSVPTQGFSTTPRHLSFPTLHNEVHSVPPSFRTLRPFFCFTFSVLHHPASPPQCPGIHDSVCLHKPRRFLEGFSSP